MYQNTAKMSSAAAAFKKWNLKTEFSNMENTD